MTHPAQAHDDLAAAICALLWRLSPGARSNADNWCESLLRQAGRGGTDYDDIYAPSGPAPSWGYRFSTVEQPKLLVRVHVPQEIAGGSIHTPGRIHVCRYGEGLPYVEVDWRTARYLLSGPPSPWHDLNRPLIEQLAEEHER